MNRLEELLKLKEEIEAEIEMLVNQEDKIIEELAENLFKEIAGADEDTCVSCLIKEALYIAYDLGYEDAILSVEE